MISIAIVNIVMNSRYYSCCSIVSSGSSSSRSRSRSRSSRSNSTREHFRPAVILLYFAGFCCSVRKS